MEVLNSLPRVGANVGDNAVTAGSDSQFLSQLLAQEHEISEKARVVEFDIGQG